MALGVEFDACETIIHGEISKYVGIFERFSSSKIVGGEFRRLFIIMKPYFTLKSP